MAAIIGAHNAGKSTLLSLISGACLPPEEDALNIFVPSHLRVLHVKNHPVFLQGTLLANLKLGTRPDDLESSSTERVKKICRKVGLTNNIISIIENGVVLDWEESLSRTECQLLSLARALIANYEVLCLDRPTSILTTDATTRIMKVLRTFVEFRGVELNYDSASKRRPRTCIMTTSKVEALEVADAVFAVSFKEGIKQIESNKKEILQEVLKDLANSNFVADGPLDERSRKKHKTLAPEAKDPLDHGLPTTTV